MKNNLLDIRPIHEEGLIRETNLLKNRPRREQSLIS